MRDEEEAPAMSRREVLRAMNAAVLAFAAGAIPDFSRGAASASGQGTKVREIENAWIPMSDGVKLAARIWLPQDAERHRVPAILNYCPYFARLFTRPDDDTRFPYYAAHGYACVRVDIRGSGDSTGLPLDEYVKQEQDDALEIIRWIAAQPWCSGSVGMEGISWSGINSLQVAACRPPALKAIITHCSTDDRYADDAHYKGGCLIDDMFDWGTLFLAIQAQPSDPAITGKEGWRKSWLERLDAVEFNLGRWLEHPHRDDFWKHGSVAEDYSRIACPVYAIGGWVDAYKNTVFRLLRGLKVPRKGLIGPWTHVYPHQGAPGPAIGYLDEALRWWDHWLKGRDTGIMSEPMLKVWMQEKSATPGEESVPGYWAAEEAWPSQRLKELKYFPGADAKLAASPAGEGAVILNPVQTVGIAAGKWCPSGAGDPQDLNTELPLDQRQDDARSIVFDSPPLTSTLEILGACTVRLEVAADKPVAFIAVRLNEVRPTGEATRVTYGVLNLCHRESDEKPSALVPGQRYTVTLRLDHIAHRFHAGNRIRLAISTTYWPLILPAPEPVTLTVFMGPSYLALRVRPPRGEDAHLPSFGPPFVPAVPIKPVSSKPGHQIIEWNAVDKTQLIRHAASDDVVLLTAVNTNLRSSATALSEISDAGTVGTITTEYVLGWQREQFSPRVVATSKITTEKSHFVLSGELHAFDGEEEVFTRRWDRQVARKLV